MAEKKKTQRSKKAAAEQHDTPADANEHPAASASDAAQAEAAEAQAPQAETPQADVPQADAPQAEVPEPQAAEPQAAEPEATEPQAAQPEEPAPEPPPSAPAVEEPAPEQVAAAASAESAEGEQATAGEGASVAVEMGEAGEPAAEEPAESAPRAKPSVPGAHLEVDIVPEGVDPLGRVEEEYEDRYAIEEEDLAPVEAEIQEEERDEVLTEPIASAAIDLAAGARYRATGKRKTAIARVTLRPGSGTYLINGRTLEQHFPRLTLQRNIRQPLETVGYQERMDVVARLQGGGISAQAGALRHGVSRALLEADPNLRGELKRRGFLTRDSRAKERKKAGLKKARKRPQFSKR
jgi:small subunit ribosomal protein S9